MRGHADHHHHHRVYHVITLGLSLYATFITGQVRLALSLRGPGHSQKFKEVCYTYLLNNYKYVYEEINFFPGEAADKHRNAVWDIFSTAFAGSTKGEFGSSSGHSHSIWCCMPSTPPFPPHPKSKIERTKCINKYCCFSIFLVSYLKLKKTYKFPGG